MYLMLSKNIIDQFTGIEREEGTMRRTSWCPLLSVATRESSKSDDSNFPVSALSESAATDLATSKMLGLLGFRTLNARTYDVTDARSQLYARNAKDGSRKSYCQWHHP